METVKETKDYTIYKKRNGRYGIKSSEKKWINGNDKIEILVKEGLIKAQVKQEEPAAAEEAPPAPADAAATEEAPAETPE